MRVLDTEHLLALAGGLAAAAILARFGAASAAASFLPEESASGHVSDQAGAASSPLRFVTASMP
jgi:hypothetical protein